MSREDYVAIATRLFAVYIGFELVMRIPTMMQAVAAAQDVAWAWLFARVLVLGLAICALLWIFQLTIARKLLPVMKESRSEQAIDASVGLSLGLTLIGAWLLAQGIVDAAYWLTLYTYTRQYVQGLPFEWTPDQIASVVATALQLVVGVGLILGSPAIRRLIHQFRYPQS
jgi:Na+/melibiose symporter-like transporter